MNVCYWNVCYETPTEALVEACAEIKKTEQIDVFCLQEVPYLPDRAVLPASLAVANALGMKQTFEHTRTLRKTPDRLVGYGTAIVAPSLHSVRAQVLRTDPLAYMPPFYKANKRVLLSAKTFERPDITIGVAHLSYKLPAKLGRQALLAEHLKLAEYLDIEQERSEMVFGGDLNCQPGDGLDDILSQVGFYGLEAGAPTYRSRHWFAGHASKDLDRAFVTQGLYGEAKLGDFGPSDHKPVIVNIL